MNITITFQGGPLDGTYEFPNYSPGNMPPQTDLNRLSAFMFLTLTNGQVGKSAMGASPAMLAGILGQGEKPQGGIAHPYTVSSRKQEGDTVFLTAHYNAPAPKPDKPMMLSEYSVKQLVEELVNRNEFMGFVMFGTRGPNGEPPKKGEKIELAHNIPPKDMVMMMKSILPQLEGQ